MNITLKPADVRDLDAIADLYGAVCDGLADKPWNPGWRRDAFPTREDAARYLSGGWGYVAWVGGAPAGFIAVTPFPNAEGEPAAPSPETKEALYIHVLAVHPGYQRQGVASILLDRAGALAGQEGAKALRLYVWEGNTPAIRTYEKSGFLRLGREDIGLGEFGLDWFYLYEKQLSQ